MYSPPPPYPLLSTTLSLKDTHTPAHRHDSCEFYVTMLQNGSHYGRLSAAEPWDPKLLFEVLSLPIILWDSEGQRLPF